MRWPMVIGLIHRILSDIERFEFGEGREMKLESELQISSRLGTTAVLQRVVISRIRS